VQPLWWRHVVVSFSARRAVRSAHRAARFLVIVRLTYGCGAYQAYEGLVRAAATVTGLPASAADDLKARWTELPVWSGVAEVLAALQGRARLAVVTNCSMRLGRLAAARLDTRWDCIVTAEEAGFYKPDARPYRLALERLAVAPREAAFVAGSAYDLVGTSAVGLRTYWHNRVALARPEGVPPPDLEWRTLDRLIPWLEGTT